MLRNHDRSLLALLLVGACTTAPHQTASVREPAPVGGHAADASVVVDASQSQREPASSEERAAQAMFREIWNSESFQRELAESHLRTSEFEPALTLRQTEQRREVLELIAAGREEDAIARLRQLQDGRTAEFDHLLGTIYLRRGDVERAVVEFRKAVAEHRAYRRAWKNLALSEMRLGNYRDAVRAFVEVIRRGGGEPSVYGFLGICHARLDDFVAAECAFRMVSMMEPTEDRWRMLLAQALFRQQRYGEGASLCGVMLGQNPDDAELWLLQAQAYVGMNAHDKAAENLEIVDSLGGSTYASLTLLGNIYFQAGQYDLAVDAYRRALPLDQNREFEKALALARNLAARSAYSESTRLLSAIEAQYGAELTKADQIELKRLRARLAAASGAAGEQVRILQEIVRDDPLDGDALLQLALHWQREGDVEKAILRCEQAARLEPFARRAKVLQAQLLVQQGRFAEARPLLQQAQQIEPRDDVQKLLDYVERAARSGR